MEQIENSIITLAINGHGILFKKAVRRELEQIPNIKIIGEEYPVRGSNGSQLDLLVEYKARDRNYLAVIECKRAYATHKKWVFFESPDKETKLIYFFENHELRVGNGNAFLDEGYRLCIEGIEIDLQKYNKQKPDDVYKIGSVDRIWQTANQVCRGYHDFVINELKNRSGNQSAANLDNFGVFSLVITTAELFICPIEKQDADLLTGNSVGNLHLQNVPYIILNHAFTPPSKEDHLKLISTDYKNPTERRVDAQEGIFILSVAHIKEFFSRLY